MEVDHAKIMDQCSEKARRDGLAALTRAERTVHLVSWANFEIECGTLWQYLYNSDGKDAPETVEALRDVDAHDSAVALQEAIPLFKRWFDGTDEADSENIQSAIYRLTDKCYDQDPSTFDCLCSYIEAHLGELAAR